MVFELQEGSSWCILSGILGFVLFMGITFWLSLGLSLHLTSIIILSLVVAIVGGFGLSKFEGVIGGIIVGVFTAIAFVLLICALNLGLLMTATIAILTNAIIEFVIGVVGGFIGVFIRASNFKVHMRPH